MGVMGCPALVFAHTNFYWSFPTPPPVELARLCRRKGLVHAGRILGRDKASTHGPLGA